MLERMWMMADDHLNPEEMALIRAALSLTARLDLEQTCEAILDTVEQMFGARSAWILLHDSAADQLVTAAFRGPGAESYADRRIPCHTGLVGQAFTQQEAIFVPDVMTEDRWADPERMYRSGLRSAFTVPIVHESEAAGIVGLDSPRFTALTPPPPVDLARLKAVAAQAAVGIKNARLFEAVEQDRVRLRRLLRERHQLSREIHPVSGKVHAASAFTEIIGRSRALRAVLNQVEIAAPADCTVLLLGETGTGKELIARVIHERSRRSANGFVAVNCAALPESLEESELFGHEKGAFTGALSRKPGQFEPADRGTLLLDEIGDLPPHAQAKLLRVVQEGEVLRIGGTHPVPVNVRLVAATNQDLEKCIADGRFRIDLFYRLNVFPIRLPPLRERLDDVPALAEHFTRCFAERLHKPVTGLTRNAIDRLMSYDWPGNVRELQNIIERAVILARSSLITADLVTLTDPVRGPITVTDLTGERASLYSEDPLDVVRFSEAERRAVLRALECTGWRVSGRGGAADLLGLKPTTLHAKMKKLGIERPSHQAPASDGSRVDAIPRPIGVS
jgi:formate hydrogenlyase transcriptional activator